jgi:hypothetical protein
VDALRRAIELAELVGIGVHMHQRLLRLRNREQLVALRRHFRQTPAHQQHEVRIADARQHARFAPSPRSPA